MLDVPPIPVPASRMLLALLLGLTAAAANILGGLFILHREWSRQYLKYFLALGAGFMLAAAHSGNSARVGGIDGKPRVFPRAGRIFHRSFF